MKPVRDEKYKAWIRTLRCAVAMQFAAKGMPPPHCNGRIEAAHTGGHGMGQKASDHRCIPLCAAHHRTNRYSYHNIGRRQFEETYQLDIEALIVQLRTKPRMELVGGVFIMLPGDVLVGEASNLPGAITNALRLWKDQLREL